jgi:predicted MFS family arabinose efflux permease
MLQAAAMRTAPDDPDGASGLYVVGFQVGIMAGSLSGGLLYERAGLALMLGASTALVMVALTGVTATRGLSRFLRQSAGSNVRDRTAMDSAGQRRALGARTG